jgi:hypothetical protein
LGPSEPPTLNARVRLAPLAVTSLVPASSRIAKKTARRAADCLRAWALALTMAVVTHRDDWTRGRYLGIRQNHDFSMPREGSERASDHDSPLLSVRAVRYSDGLF